MPDSTSPAVKLFDELFGNQQPLLDVGLKSLKGDLDNGLSIFSVVDMGVQGLVHQYNQLSPDHARQFLRRANGVATYVRRQFIEHNLSTGKRKATAPSNGVLSMVEGPRFESLFWPDFDSKCPSDALESCAGPVAYLIDLLLWIEERIEFHGIAGKILPLHERRKDLKLLSVDFNAVYRSVSSVDIIIAVLEAFIAKTPDELDTALATARYPNGLPYYQPWVTLDLIVRANGKSVGDFVHQVSPSYPYFLQSDGWGDDAARARTHASRLSPYQRQLLTGKAPEHAKKEEFYTDNFGAWDFKNDEAEWEILNVLSTFAERTKLDTTGVEALLSIGDFAPVRSANGPVVAKSLVGVESGKSGSVYINANKHPGILITRAVDDNGEVLHMLSVDPATPAGLDQLDRMNRKLRLDKWLELPSDQVDALLAAAMRADARSRIANTWEISDNVVYALGLFKALHDRYQCTAADFAVFIDELSIYGRGEALSQFDQVFNRQGGYLEPLKLDDQPFPVTLEPGVSDLTVNQLCSGLEIDLQTYQYLASAVAEAFDVTDTLTRSAAIISSFYRLVKLPRLLNITPVEGVLVLRMLGGATWVKGLAGKPLINTAPSGTPNALNLIDAMKSFVQWCDTSEVAVLWMLQQVAETPPTRETSAQDQQFYEQIANLLPNARLSNAAFLTAGVPSAGASGWLDFLTTSVDGRVPVADADGLILTAIGTTEAYLSAVRATLEWAVENAFRNIKEAPRDEIVEIMLDVVLEARDAQESLVKETLAVYAGVQAALAIPTLNWSGATVYQFLRQVVEHIAPPAQEAPALRWGRNDGSGLLLDQMAKVRRRGAVVSTLGFSAELLQDYLDYGHKSWLDQDDKYALDFPTLYYLTALTNAFKLSQQPAQTLLDYLREVNALPEVKGDALKLAQQVAAFRLADFFGWSVQDVRECVMRIEPGAQIVKKLTHLEQLMRIREWATATDMEAVTIFKIGNLPETVDPPAYAAAAELALSSTSRSQAPLIQVPGDLKSLVRTTCVQVGGPDAVARNPDSIVRYTITVTDAQGNAVKGVNVHWSATLGSIATAATDMNGVVEQTYIQGNVLGSETPMYWLDLLEPEFAQAINVVAEPDSYFLVPESMSALPTGIVPRGEEVELYARVEDAYGNLGIDALVSWSGASSEVVIRPANGFSDQEGITRVFVSSAAGGTFRITAVTAGTSNPFGEITFAGDIELI